MHAVLGGLSFMYWLLRNIRVITYDRNSVITRDPNKNTLCRREDMCTKTDGHKTGSTPNPSGETIRTYPDQSKVWVGYRFLHIVRFCAFLDGTKDFPFLVLILVLSTCLKCFYREPGHPLLLDVTSWMVVVNSMDKINSFYTILLLFFIFFFLFSSEGLAGKPFWRLECIAYPFLCLDGLISQYMCRNFSPIYIRV